MSNISLKTNKEKRGSISLNKLIEQISIKMNDDDATYKNMNNRHQGCILSLLIKNYNEKRNSFKTTDTNIFMPYNPNYKFSEIKRFDELNNSLSDISDFDLENQINKDKSEFNSSEEDNSEEGEEIVIHNKQVFNKKKYDSEYENELEKDFKEILKELHIGEKLEHKL